MKLTPEERASLSPAEIAALEDSGADQALATMGDTELDVKAAADTADDAADDAQDDANTEGADDDAAGDDAADDTSKAADDGALTAEQLAAIAKDTEPAEPAKPTTYDVQERDFAAERRALRDSRKELQAKWDAGDLTDEDLQAKLDEVDDKLDALAAEKARAETLKAINEQHARDAAARIEAEETEATVAIIKAAKGTVDYVKDTAAQAQFDMALNMLKADPENAKKTPAQLVQQAHQSVLAIRGLLTPAASPAGSPAPQPKPTRRDVPATLGGLPNAAPVPLEDDLVTQASRLSGEDLEAYLARLSPAQEKRLLRNIDNSAARH